MTPLSDRVVLKCLETPELKKNGLYMPDTLAQQKTYEVLAISNTEKDLNIGDKVLIDKYSHHEVMIEEMTYVVVDKKNIILRL